MKTDPTKPSLSLLCKLGGIAVHIDEFMSPAGAPVDLETAQQLIEDPEVKTWIKDMGAFLPLKR